MSDNLDFINRATKRFGRKRMEAVESTIRKLLAESVDPIYDHSRATRTIVHEHKEIIGSINNPDYAQAFGYMQGVAKVMGYKSCCVTSDKMEPGYWFDILCTETWKAAYKKEFDK